MPLPILTDFYNRIRKISEPMNIRTRDRSLKGPCLLRLGLERQPVVLVLYKRKPVLIELYRIIPVTGIHYADIEFISVRLHRSLSRTGYLKIPIGLIMTYIVSCRIRIFKVLNILRQRYVLIVLFLTVIPYVIDPEFRILIKDSRAVRSTYPRSSDTHVYNKMEFSVKRCGIRYHIPFFVTRSPIRIGKVLLTVKIERHLTRQPFKSVYVIIIRQIGNSVTEVRTSLIGRIPVMDDAGASFRVLSVDGYEIYRARHRPLAVRILRRYETDHGLKSLAFGNLSPDLKITVSEIMFTGCIDPRRQILDCLFFGEYSLGLDYEFTVTYKDMSSVIDVSLFFFITAAGRMLFDIP